MKIFDAHFHIINPEFPLVENKGYTPPEFRIEAYKNRVKTLETTGGAIVSGSFQAFDQSYLIDSLNRMGDKFFGVANVPYDMPNAELTTLHNAGVRAVRFNLKRGGSETIKHLTYLSNKLYAEYGWHTELYIDSEEIKLLGATLAKLPPFSIDHLGLSESGLQDLYKLVEKGAKVKATGFGRISFDPIPVMKKIYHINPEALMFGTDLPSTRADRPFSIQDIQLLTEHFSTEEQEDIFYKNGMNWYNK